MQIKDLLRGIYRKYRRMQVANIKPWQNDTRLRVAIQCTKYFTKARWLENIRDTFSEIEKYWQIKFYNNAYEREMVAPELDAVFTLWVNNEFIDLAKRLKWAFVPQSGLEFLENKTYNFDVVTAGGFSAQAVAEYVMCASLMLLRRIDQGLINQLKKTWIQTRFLKHGLNLLSTRTVGILGLGKSGRATAAIFKRVGCSVFGYDERDVRASNIDTVYRCDQLDIIAGKSDILVICLPLNSKTQNLIGMNELQLLGSNGILVNVARGEIVNESDLIYALHHNVIAGAALDVCQNEPLPRTSRLWKCPNIIITPHIAGNVNYFVDDIQTEFLKKLKKYVSEAK